MGQKSHQKELLDNLLTKNSRSFAITLHALPGQQRNFVAFTYLVARVADTLADSGNWDWEERSKALAKWEERLLLKNSKFDPKISLGALPDHEAQLLAHAEELAEVWTAFPENQKHSGEELLKILMSAMRWQVSTFRDAKQEAPVFGISSDEDFDFYCYQHAGCVGRFWVQVFSLPSDLESLAISYGKGLERLNILRDVVEDRQQGRILLAKSQLEAFSLSSTEPWREPGWKNFVEAYAKETRTHLTHAAQFVDAIPNNQRRLRWASMMPLKIAAESLRLYESETGKEGTTKITRKAVKRLARQSLIDSLLARKLTQKVP